ncbi:MAG: transposase [Methylocella sp.]
MPELGAIEHRHAARLAGLARLARQSGRWTGRAGGQAGFRQALYVLARVAVRLTPELKAKYAKLVEAGKPTKVASPRSYASSCSSPSPSSEIGVVGNQNSLK